MAKVKAAPQAPKAAQPKGPLLKLLVLTALMTFIVIVLGAATRVADAGLSCPDWPTCYGQWFPFPAPEGGYHAEGITYTLTQVLLEWTHRLTASLTGFLLLASLFFAYKFRGENKRVFRVGLFALLALLTQVKMGGITVWLDNINWSVALHLGNAMIFYSLLIAMISAAVRPANVTPIKAALRTKLLMVLAYVMVFFTMLAGAMVFSTHAGGVCGGLFDCVGSWWPADDVAQQIHMIHRYMVALTIFTLLALRIEARREHPALNKTAKVAEAFIIVQIALGILTLYSFSHYANFYQFLSVAHLAWGTVLLTVVLTGCLKLLWGEKDPTIKIMPGHP